MGEYIRLEERHNTISQLLGLPEQIRNLREFRDLIKQLEQQVGFAKILLLLDSIEDGKKKSSAIRTVRSALRNRG